MSSQQSKNWQYYLCAELIDLSSKKSINSRVYPTLEEDSNDYDYIDRRYNTYCVNNTILFQKLDEFVADEQSIDPGNYKLSRILFVNSSNELHRKEFYLGMNLYWDGIKFTNLDKTNNSKYKLNDCLPEQDNKLVGDTELIDSDSDAPYDFTNTHPEYSEEIDKGEDDFTNPSLAYSEEADKEAEDLSQQVTKWCYNKLRKLYPGKKINIVVSLR